HRWTAARRTGACAAWSPHGLCASCVEPFAAEQKSRGAGERTRAVSDPVIHVHRTTRYELLMPFVRRAKAQDRHENQHDTSRKGRAHGDRTREEPREDRVEAQMNGLVQMRNANARQIAARNGGEDEYERRPEYGRHPS